MTVDNLFKHVTSLFWCILLDLEKQFGYFSKNNYDRASKRAEL